MVITVQIIKLTNEPTFQQAEVLSAITVGQDAGFQSDCVADQRNDRRNNSHAPPAAVFLQQTGNNQRKTDGVGDKREQSKNGHSDVDSLSNKKEKQYSVR